MTETDLGRIVREPESGSGTKRTNWAGLMMSVGWGGPEVAGGASNRRD
jgi:hypothetical protein